jgi:hypothetical protein
MLFFVIDFCTCDGSGYPHYYTPDGALIDFMGTCKYTLWNSTIPNDRCEFRVETKNERRYRNNNVAWTRFIDFYIKNIKIRILKGGTTVVSVFYNYFIIVFYIYEPIFHDDQIYCKKKTKKTTEYRNKTTFPPQVIDEVYHIRVHLPMSGNEIHS